MIEYIAAAAVMLVFTALALRKNAVAMLSIAFTLIYIIEIALFYISPSLAGVFIITLGAKYPLDWGVITGIFLHSLSPGHIFFNILFFFLAGLPFEHRVGSARLTLIFFVSGIAANIGYSLFLYAMGVNSVLIGASGAIFGVMGAFIIMYPNDEIAFFLGPILMPKIKVKIAILALLLIEFISTLLWVNDNIAHGAHVIGAVTGALLGLYYIKRKPQLDKTILRTKELFRTTFEELATTDKLRRIYARILEEDDETIRKAWIEEFFREKFGAAKLEGRYVVANNKKYRVYK